MKIQINPSIIQCFAVGLGVIGSFIGAYYWWNDHIPELLILNETDITLSRRMDYRQDEMAFLLLFFVPACMAFIGSMFKKTYLLFLAFLLSLPVGEYIGFNVNSINSVHFPLYLYFLSAILLWFVDMQRKHTST